MSRGLMIVSFVLASLLSLALHVALYSPISPLPLSLPSPPSNLTPNNLLQRVEKLGDGKLVGPEDVWVGPEGALYTATRDGWIKRVHQNGSVEDWKFIGGPALLGITGSRDGTLLVCDVDKGLLKVGEEGVTTLATHVDDGSKISEVLKEALIPLLGIGALKGNRYIHILGGSFYPKSRTYRKRFADEAIEASDGSVYFSDASNKFGLFDWFLDVLEAKPHGRLLKYDPLTKKTSVVISDLAFANGVALSLNEDFVVVCETWRFRCLKYWLKGEHKGESEIFIHNLPGGPDDIILAPDGDFWIALLQVRSGVLHNLIHRSPTAKRAIAAFPKLLKMMNPMKKGAMATKVAANGTIDS